MLFKGIVLFKRIKHAGMFLLDGLEKLFILPVPVFLRGCPKCGGKVFLYGIKNSDGEEQYCCRECKIKFPENNFAQYEDAFIINNKRRKQRILRLYAKLPEMA